MNIGDRVRVNHRSPWHNGETGIIVGRDLFHLEVAIDRLDNYQFPFYERELDLISPATSAGFGHASGVEVAAELLAAAQSQHRCDVGDDNCSNCGAPAWWESIIAAQSQHPPKGPAMTFRPGDRVTVIDYPRGRDALIGRRGSVTAVQSVTPYVEATLDARVTGVDRHGEPIITNDHSRYLFLPRELEAEHIPSATAEGTHSPAGARKEATMENIFITIDGVTHEFAEVVAPAAAAPAPVLNINRTFVVYDANGDRVDGYKYESRARRNNDARFAGTGYWLGKANADDFTWVPA